MLDLERDAKHAHPSFAEHVLRYPADVREQLERFIELDDLDQAAVVLHLARYSTANLALAYAGVNDLPCWGGPCGHPRHVGGCEIPDCECYR